MTEEVEQYETTVVHLEPGQQLVVKAAHRTVYLVHKRSGLHIADHRDGRRGAKVRCLACNEFVFSAGCSRPGCPLKERVYAKP